MIKQQRELSHTDLPQSLRQARFSKNALLHSAGILSCGLYLYLGAITSITIDSHPWQFLGLMLILSLISWMLFKVLFREISSINADSVLSSPPSVAAIVGWAIAFRLIGMAHSPIYEDDFYRYLWDGYQFFQNGTPYGIAPSAFFGDDAVPPSFQRVLDGINYPDTPTIYGPLFQYTFLLGYLIFPADVFGLQLIYSIADILLVLLLAKMSSRPALLLYAWCPLIVKEVAFTAHPDTLGVLLLMGSIFALQREHLNTAAFLLALSLCAKVFAILLVPLVLIRCRPQQWLLFFATVLLIYAPFFMINSADITGLSAFARDWQFNGSVHALISHWQKLAHLPDWFPKIFGAVVFCTFYLVYSWYFFNDKQRRPPRGDLIFAVFFLLAPVVNAWYLVWLLAFATLYPSRWAWVASLSVLLSYVTGATLEQSNLELYQQPLWARILEYGAIIVALGFDIRASNKQPPAIRLDMNNSERLKSTP